jgi:hypothetical protein
MKILSRYRVAVHRSAGETAGVRPGIALAAVCTVAVAVFALPAAAAGPSANLSVSLSTVTQAVKSVTISPTSVSYSGCVYGSSSGSNLGFPNGACQTQTGVNVQNGSAPATIMVNGADMAPSDSGTHWMLCQTGGPPGQLPCANGTTTPGDDQYYETVSTSQGVNTGTQRAPGNFQPLSNQPSCDTAIGSGVCVTNLSAGTAALEFLAVTGPHASSDPSTSWSTSVTWTAT